MRPVVLTLKISASAAVRAGNASMGAVKVRLSDEAVQALTDEQRDTLARHLDRIPRYLQDKDTDPPRQRGEVRWQDYLTSHADPIGEVTEGTVASLLDQRRAKMIAQGFTSAGRVEGRRAEGEIR